MEQGRKTFYAAYEHKVRTEVSYLNGDAMSYRRIFFHQAEALARVVKGETAEYLPFLMRQVMFFVVAYDMPDTKRRTKLLKALKGFGIHTQFSLFECELDNHEFARMLTAIDKTINKKEDAVKVYRLCRECLGHVHVSGLDRVAVEADCVII